MTLRNCSSAGLIRSYCDLFISFGRSFHRLIPKHNRLAFAAGCFLAVFAGNPALADTLIIQDKYDVAGDGTGFAPNTGVNSGIASSKTRLAGSAVAGVQYLPAFTNKPAAAYSVADKK